MARPVTLFTGQWADLPLEELAEKVAGFGYDGLELACWGDHFEVDKALEDDGYVQSRWDILNKYGLKCFAISTHLVGQCVCDDPIDERHKGVLPSRIWGDGDPEGDDRGDHHGVYLPQQRPTRCPPSPISPCTANGAKKSIGTVPPGANRSGRSPEI